MALSPELVVLVTGANRGIGLETCRQLGGYGVTVLLGARDARQGVEAVERLSMGPGRFEPLTIDVSDAASVAAAAAFVRERHGRLDVLVNNAGIHYDTWQTALDADLVSVVPEALAVNLLGAWRTSQAFGPAMKGRGWGRIVNVSSEAGSLASMGAGPPAYQVSKAALNALTRTLAGELNGTGVLVNAVCPGWVATDMGGGGGRPVEVGAAGVVWAATLPDGGPSGGFFRDGKPLRW